MNQRHEQTDVDDNSLSLLRKDVTRRSAIKYLGGSFAVAAAGTALAACGSSGSSSNSSATGGGSSTTGSTGSGSSNAPLGTALTAAEKQTLLKMVGPVDSKFAGKGMVWKVGGFFPFTGPDTYYQTIEGDGLRLAVNHIAQLGGPNIQVSYQNVGGPEGIDTQKAVDGVLALHDANIAMAVSFGGGAGGAIVPGVGRYKILNIDAGAGVGSFADKPYYWSSRSEYPGDEFTLILKYLTAKMPNATNIAMVSNSGASNLSFVTLCLNAIKAQPRFKLLTNAQEAQGSTDWSNQIAALRAANPQAILLQVTGNDTAYFMKQYATSGLTIPVFAASYSQPQAQLAGSSFENMYYSQEAFAPDQPSNEWGAILTKHYRAAFKDQPSSPASPLNLSANYYQLGFVIWELARRVLAKGGSINDSTALQDALVANPQFPSIFGGSGTTPGAIKFDTKSHGLANCPLGLYQVRNSAPFALAYGNSDGTDFKLA